MTEQSTLSVYHTRASTPRGWRVGAIVKHDGAIYRIAGHTRSRATSGGGDYQLVPATPEEAARRQARVKLRDGSAHHVGRVIDLADGTTMVVRRIVRRAFSGACGHGYTYTGEGPLLSPEQAKSAIAKDPHRIARALRDSLARVDRLPAGAEKVYADLTSPSSTAWYAVGDDVYYVESNYDCGPTTYRSSATRKQIEQAAKLGLPVTMIIL